MEKVVGLGMSGGVDSSVAAYLLKQQGYKVVGITMRLITGEKTENAIEDAKKVCDILEIPHYVVDFKEEFRKIVIDNFIESYEEGKTPNPCCVCNKYFKFGLFYEAAVKLGCDYIATGHYACIKDGKLYRAKVLEKDQSYFLWGIDKNILKHVIFPLANYNNKEEIRQIATSIKLEIAKKKDSQEICFIPDDNYKKFLDSELISKPIKGEICLENGEVLGLHNGLIYYTIGQRKGLNISYKEPLYVIKIDTLNNKLIVGPNDSLFKTSLVAGKVNLLDEVKDGDYFAKVRSRGSLRKCYVKFREAGKMDIKFVEAERAITLGQSVVLYDESGACLGGGIIEEVGND